MEKLKEIILHVKKSLGLKAKGNDEESEKEIGSYSMNEGKPDKVFGFRREIVKGIVAFFGTVLVLALIFASDDSEEPKKEVATLPIATESEIAKVKKTKNTLPDDYESLIAMNKAKEKELELQRQAEENAKKSVTQIQPSKPTNVIEVEPQVQAISQEQYKQYEVLPETTQLPVLPEKTPEPQPAKVEKNPHAEGDKYKSAIAFTFGEETSQQSEPINEIKASETVQKKTEYVEPNNSTLDAGTVIPVRLLTGISTDVEGQVMAQVLTDVYDTATGTKLLIPQGSRLTGVYEKKSVKNGRVPVTFKQLTLPNGGSWTISENIVAVDGAGYTGIAGKVHHHTSRKISAGTMGSAIAALGSLAAGNVSSSANTYTAGQIAAQGATANLINMTSSMLKESAEIENTVTIEPGYEFNVYVIENITF